MREVAKSLLGSAARTANPQCRFDRTVFVLAHMRCGSTALSNILCSRCEISGYGEAHIRYRSANDLGRLVVNQTLRKAWKPNAQFLFDKLLHNRHDAGIPSAFFQARAIFLCRQPDDTIRSIKKLFTTLGRSEFTTDTLAAEYYVSRVERLIELWQLFPDDNRIGFDYETLTDNTALCLQRVSVFLGLKPPLKNSYQSHEASTRGGGGDPISSAKMNMIAPKHPSKKAATTALEIDDALRDQAFEAYTRFADAISSTPQISKPAKSAGRQ